MNSLLWMLTGSDLKTATSTLFEQVWDIMEIVIWILVAILAIVFIVKAVMTALAVMKAADEPQVRQEKIAGFKFLAIGLGIAIVVLSLTNVLMPLIMGFGNKDINSGVTAPGSGS